MTRPAWFGSIASGAPSQACQDLDIAYCLRLTASVHRCYPLLGSVDHYAVLLFEAPCCCCACHMAFCKLAHDLLDPCRKAQMPRNLP